MSPASRTIERWAGLFPSKVALHFQGRDWTYAALWERIRNTSLRITKGDRIAWLGYNCPEMLVLLFAAARQGAIVVPLNWRLTAAEHREILRDCSPKWLFCGKEFEAHAKELGVPIGDFIEDEVEENGGEDLLIVYTSGTTGKPKGAVLTQSALHWNSLNSVYAHDLRQDDHVLTALPMFHVGGLNIQTLPALLFGASVTLHARFDPGHWLADIEARRPTLSLLVPAAMAAVIAHPKWKETDLSSLRLLNTGSMVVPDSLIRAFHDRGVPVGQIYGATETAPIATALLRNDCFSKVGSAGKPVPHCEVKLVDDEIWVRGPSVMRGYWNGGGLTGDGWFRSGDLARMDEDGFYWVVGRSREVIISGGENIHPAELENVLADCAGIAEAAVVPVTDDKWGETACACVVRRDESLLEKDVLRLFENRLARYKHPRRIVFLDALPRNAMGKVVKSELRRLVDPKLDGAEAFQRK